MDTALGLGIKPVATTYMTAGREPEFLLPFTITGLATLPLLARRVGLLRFDAASARSFGLSRDRYFWLDQGRLVFDGRPAELAASGLIETVFQLRGQFMILNDQPQFDIDLLRALRHGDPADGRCASQERQGAAPRP